VHKVEVKVLYSELVKRVLNGLANVVVVEFEKLRGDPNLLTGDTRELDSLSDLVFVLVTPGAVNVTVTRLESVAHGITNLTLGRLPGTETDRRDRGTRVELEMGSGPSDDRSESPRRGEDRVKQIASNQRERRQRRANVS